MQRRDFLAATGAVGAGLLATQAASTLAQTGSIREFKLKYAPHFGMFKNLAGDDPARPAPLCERARLHGVGR